MNECIETWCTKRGYGKNLFNEWKSNIIQKVDSRIHHLSSKLDIKESSFALKENNVKQHSEDVSSKYVIAPIDKATGNGAIICWIFYGFMLVNPYIAGVSLN